MGHKKSFAGMAELRAADSQTHLEVAGWYGDGIDTAADVVATDDVMEDGKPDRRERK